MTTYAEAVQMGIAANLAVGIQNEVICAGNALSNLMLVGDSIRTDLPEEVVSVLSHVMNHLTAIREFTEVADEYYDTEIPKFDEANPGQLLHVSAEIADLPIVSKFQDIINMSPAARRAKKESNLRDIQTGNGTLN